MEINAPPKKKALEIRQRSKELACAAIIDAAERVLYRSGWIGGTMEEIAREAGLTKNGILYYFHSKNDLLAAMLKWHAGRRRSFIAERIANAERNVPVGRVALLAWLDFILTDKSYAHSIVYFTGDPELRRQVFESRREMLREWSADSADPVETAMLFTMVEGVLLACFHEEPVCPEDVRQQLVAKMRARIQKLK